MGTDRREFLQVAGLAGLGVMLAIPAIKVFSTLQPGNATEGSSSEGTSQKRLAMLVDINKCAEAQPECGMVCQTACHQWHNVPDIPDREEEIKWIWQDTYGRVFEEDLIPYVDEEDEKKLELPVMLLCNQCTNPPCIKYCPTRATWKRGSDGIVMVDFHRCIGCRYCMAGCPFGARSFNWRDPRKALNMETVNLKYPTRTRGVVEKCNFCADRLDKLDPATGEFMIPACVEACPEVLIFGDLADENSEISQRLKAAGHVLRRLPELGTNPNNYYILE